ncbi:perlucin-like [Haliotis rufescens]|uniref:perlucin-like n=1 Tax=Haliotis rufescens TaxID=6454 RepID=UPI00201FA241|nr:perlucin-like [Haliotis rufescens]
MLKMFNSSVSIIVVLAVMNVVSCDCPNGFLHHDDSCYSLIRVQASWAEAAVYCQAIGSHLAYVETDSEQTFVEGYLKREDSTITTDGVWIGGLTYLTEKEWQWGFQNTRIASTFWAPEDPNNDGGSQWCLMLYKKGDFRWDDNECDENEFFLCELEFGSSPDIVGK